MISEYKDMLEKARFYKKQVIQSFIKQGYFPSDEEIQTALSDIDMRSALLDTYLSAKGSLFNTKEINFMFECIYKDLNIGTAKITEEEKEGIPHHLFDIKNIIKRIQ